MRLRFWLAAPIALALGGCELASRYAPPSISLPAKFKDEPTGGVELSANESWWRSFNDRRLDDLEAQVDAANPDLAAAIAANDAAVARAAQAAAGLLPQIDGIGQITANRQSNNRPTRGANQPDYYGNNILGGQVSYEIDIWGRVRDLVKAANLTAEASADASCRGPARTARGIGPRLRRPARPRRPGEAHHGHDRHLSLRARSDEVPTPGADRVAGRRRPRADAAELGRGARVGDRAPAGGARRCDCGPGRKTGGVLLHREVFARLFRCRSGRAPSRPRCCDGGRTSPNRSA